ncbi:MAG TPA: 2Fe-2S iron-sulfur cluster-binding protein [Cytophagales bacterium]|nr:2Fe-2S iron-sulfur cluster-binding protein [Cytophagales bacterium]
MSNKLEILNIIEETPYSRSITFKIPENLKSSYKFLPGQYLTLTFEIDRVKHKRCYSISSCPFTEPNLTIAVKRVKGGFISNYLNEAVKVGDAITVEKPLGNFKIEAGGFFKFNHYVFFAGGSGITPILSMIQAVLHKESFAKVLLFYGNEDEHNIIYRAKLDQLLSKYPGKLNVVHVLKNAPAGWAGASGLLNQQNCASLLEKHVKSVSKSKYYICGPLPMMEQVQAALKAAGVNNNQINIEYFTAPASDKVESSDLDISTPNKKDVILWIDGKQHLVTISKKENIIAAAIRADIDAPYSCRTGACSTCKAKLIKGQVHMDVTTGLSAQELADGYILCCQSTPLTADVEVEFVN